MLFRSVRVLGNKTIVTNGDQTDTIYEGMDRQLTFEQSLRSREFEPDAPNYTPRISGVLHVEDGKFNYAMSILKSNNGNPDSCLRYTFAYENAAAGQGRFIHTYKCDGNPLPSFEGDPDAFRPKTSLVQKACRLTQSDKLKSVKLLSPNPVMKVWLKRELDRKSVV